MVNGNPDIKILAVNPLALESNQGVHKGAKFKSFVIKIIVKHYSTTVKCC